MFIFEGMLIDGFALDYPLESDFPQLDYPHLDWGDIWTNPIWTEGILVLARSRKNWLIFFSLDLEKVKLQFSITISSRQVRARKIIFDLVSTNISHDILESWNWCCTTFWLRQLMKHQQNKNYYEEWTRNMNSFKHCQRHNGPRVLTLYLELAHQLKLT